MIYSGSLVSKPAALGPKCLCRAVYLGPYGAGPQQPNLPSGFDHWWGSVLDSLVESGPPITLINGDRAGEIGQRPGEKQARGKERLGS